MTQEIFILGVGGSTPITMELAEACGYKVAGFYHFEKGKTGKSIYGVPILGTHDELLSENTLSDRNFALSMGSNEIRASLYEKIVEKKGSFPTLIHPTCVISRFSTIGNGCQLEAFCSIQANSSIGNNCLVRPNVTIGHNTNIGDHSFIAAHSMIGAYMSIGKKVFIGLSAILISAKVKSIGDNAIIGAGAVVNKDVDTFAVVVGNPAKRIK